MFKMQKLINTHSEDRSELTFPAVLSAVALNGSHVYTVNNHVNNESPVS